MTERVEAKIRAGTYVVGAILVALVVVFVNYLSIFTRGGMVNPSYANTWTANWLTNFSFILFFPLIISAIAALIGPSVRKGELVLIISMVMVSWQWPTYSGIWWTTTMLGTAKAIPAFQDWTLGYGVEHNWIFGPDPNVEAYWESWLYGGPVPWDVWLPSRIISIASVLPLALSYVFLATLWRRMWVDIEVLPFPLWTANASLVSMAYEKTERGTPKILSNMWLWLGLVLGFFGIFPLWAPDVLPGLAITKMVEPEGFPQETNLTPLALIPNFDLNFNVNPTFIGAAFLVPTTTLLSYIVGTICFQLIMRTLPVYMGIWEAWPAGTVHNWDMARGWTGPMMKTWVDTWGATFYTSLGAMLGLIYYPLWIHRGEVVDTIKATFGKVRPEVEEREPTKYRYLWAGYIICVLAYVVMWDFRTYGGQSYGHLPYLAGIIWVVMTGWMYMIGQARVTAEYGIVMDAINCNLFAHNWNEGIKTWQFSDTASPFFIRDVKERYLVQSSDVSWFSHVIRVAPFAYLLGTYKMASIHGVRSKHIFLGAVIATIIGVVLVPFVSLQLWCTYGATRLSEFAYEGSPGNYFQRGPTYSTATEVGDYWRGGFIAQPNPIQWIQTAVSAAFIIVLYVFRARYAWFPLNPAGVALGFNWVIDALLLPSIIAYVLKLIVLRIGGVKLYEEKAMPLMVGVTAAMGVSVILSDLTVSTLPR